MLQSPIGLLARLIEQSAGAAWRGACRATTPPRGPRARATTARIVVVGSTRRSRWCGRRGTRPALSRAAVGGGGSPGSFRTNAHRLPASSLRGALLELGVAQALVEVRVAAVAAWRTIIMAGSEGQGDHGGSQGVQGGCPARPLFITTATALLSGSRRSFTTTTSPSLSTVRGTRRHRAPRGRGRRGHAARRGRARARRAVLPPQREPRPFAARQLGRAGRALGGRARARAAAPQARRGARAGGWSEW